MGYGFEEDVYEDNRIWKRKVIDVPLIEISPIEFQQRASKDDKLLQSIRSSTLRILIILYREWIETDTYLVWKTPPSAEWIMDKIKCSRRTAYD